MLGEVFIRYYIRHEKFQYYIYNIYISLYICICIHTQTQRERREGREGGERERKGWREGERERAIEQEQFRDLFI